MGTVDLDEVLSEALWKCALQINPDANWRRMYTAYTARQGQWRWRSMCPSPQSLKKNYGLTVKQFNAIRFLIYGDSMV